MHFIDGKIFPQILHILSEGKTEVSSFNKYCECSPGIYLKTPLVGMTDASVHGNNPPSLGAPLLWSFPPFFIFETFKFNQVDFTKICRSVQRWHMRFRSRLQLLKTTCGLNYWNKNLSHRTRHSLRFTAFIFYLCLSGLLKCATENDSSRMIVPPSHLTVEMTIINMSAKPWMRVSAATLNAALLSSRVASIQFGHPLLILKGKLI